MNKVNNFDNDSIKKIEKGQTSSFYFKIGVLIAIIIFLIINIIKRESLSANIPLVCIYFAGETVNLFYKFANEKKNSDLILVVVGIIVVVAGIILSI